MAGLFITFEGGEGTGKSTQATRLAAWFESIGRPYILTREPGGTPEGEKLRSLLVDGDVHSWSPEAEALLNYAARDAHIRNLIRPSLDAGKIVICDRYIDSTYAYQVVAGGCDAELVATLRRLIAGHVLPDLTFIFDIDPEIGLTRAHQRSGAAEDRFERKGLQFHGRLRRGFQAIATDEPNRCRLIDASQSVEEIENRIREYVEALDG